MRTIVCKNDTGQSSEFNNERFEPYLLCNAEGLYEVYNDVALSKNTSIDGATYQGSVTKARNIVLNVAMQGNEQEHQKHRDFIMQLFRSDTPGELLYLENEVQRRIDYVVQSVKIEPRGFIRHAFIQLICPDPYFSNLTRTQVQMSGSRKCFEFFHEFKEPEPIEEKVIYKLKDITNNSVSKSIGFVAEITAEGDIKNPSLYHVQTDELIQVGTNKKPLYLKRGDKLIIVTETRNKNVYLERNGERKSVNEYLLESSRFIQLINGKNSLRYAAEEGERYMSVSIFYKERFAGV